MLAITSCKKDRDGKTVIIYRDCTGTYLRHEGKDYHVCNTDKIASFSTGSTAQAIFTAIDDCIVTGNICAMYHTNEGWINVEQIK